MTEQMSRLAAELVGELLHNYPRGRITLALDGLHGDDAAPLATALSEELAARSIAVQRVRIPDAAAVDAFRALVLPAFRTDAQLPHDAVLLAEGTRLHADGIVDVWSLSIWVSTQQLPAPDDGEAHRYLVECDPPRRADVIIDVSDPAHPVRRFADWCVVPRRMPS